MTHILYIVTQADSGGAQKYVYDLATGLDSRQFQVSVAVGQSADRSLVTRLKAQNVPAYELQHLVRPISPLKDAMAVWEITRLIHTVRPTHVHLNSSKADIIGSLASLLAHLTGTPHRLITTIHGWPFLESINIVAKAIYLIAEILVAPIKHQMIFITAKDQAIARDFPINHSVLIPNGINTDLTLLEREVARVKLNLPAGNIIIGTIANFYAPKDLPTFIGVIKKLREKNNKVIGAIIGDGMLRPELEKIIADERLTSFIHLLGKRDNAAQYLSAFDIYLCTSTKEGFPFSILEAMTAHLPIVATDVGGISTAIRNGETGLLCPASDPSALANGVTILITDREKAQRLATNAEQLVKKEFTVDQMIGETAKCYRD